MISDPLPLDFHPKPWNSIEAVNYEVAIETLNTTLGACNGRISVEEKRSNPDPAVIAECQEIAANVTKQLGELDPDDTQAVTAVYEKAPQQQEKVRAL